MSVRAIRATFALAAVVLCACVGIPARAHRTVVSQYTFNKDVRPILESRCGRCHADDGPAPAALLRYTEARRHSWRMQQELLTGRMPPWDADDSGEAIQNATRLTAHEFDVLMTWAAGGTPEGEAGTDAGPTARPSPVRAWPTGTPDLVLPVPDVVQLDDTHPTADKEYVLPLSALRGRAIRAADLRPGTPALVRRAEFAVIAPGHEQVVGVWVPGEAQPLPTAGAFTVPRDARLRVRVHYAHPRAAAEGPLTDRSEIGLYTTRATVPDVRSLELGEGLTTVPARRRAVAWRLVAGRTDAVVRLTLVLPDGTPRLLARGRPNPTWPRRYVFATPVEIPAGSQLLVAVTPGVGPVLAPLLGAADETDASPVRLAIDLTR